MSSVCIIPARGGSKRIPKKNIMEFFGKPMIAWTIEAALESKVFDKVIVSTDSEEIAQISKSFGAEVPFLRDEKNDDLAPSHEATISTLKKLKTSLGIEFDIVAQLMANCPLRDQTDIRNGFRNFKDNNLEFQLSCFKFGWMNPWWAMKVSSQKIPEPLFPEALKKRSQDLPHLYCPTGAVWFAQSKSLINANTFYGPGYQTFEIGWMSAVDIDDYEDIEMAKAAFLVKNKKV